MPFSIRLEPDMENTLTRLARRSNRAVSDVVREAIEQYVVSLEPVEDAVRPYDRIAHLIGRVDSGGSTRSVDTGRQFTSLLQERRRARRAD
jgi:predicted DNA-binding protein